ncbi:RNA binding S1 domain protein [Chloroherpeton thalassium ATCC 35110]|uniref:RNA binding S1 domain protein n=1 Tax=Chloroherpeton thalassium (strain ATCC 35110 / GB-78) TaxID=517418 RepID=B3QUX6_CHLT3|nr:Tex family protein [Chloroherpeton thalassium]ACF14477.1 RNA binding S1 domain protein [Chloroherpeton thalassium ATCC 35110]
MLNIPQVLTEELSVKLFQVENTLALLDDGATIPFIARYRKERTGGLDEIQLRTLAERYEYLQELEDRKETVLKSINEQGKLTDELKEKIENCLGKTELEDLYLPYKPKKRTKATIAKEKGLEPLAEFIHSLNTAAPAEGNFMEEAAKYISEEKEVKTAEEALQGASDILAEQLADKADFRAYIRNFIMDEGYFVSKIKDEFEEGTTKYEMYRNFKVKVKDIQPHNMLALRRGESDGVVAFSVEFDEAVVLSYLESQEIFTANADLRAFLSKMVKDAFGRLMKTTLIGEVRLDRRMKADEDSIKTFEANLRELLLSSPAGMKPTLGIDPGFRTGCKIVAIDETGKFLEYKTIFPHTGEAKKAKAVEELKTLIEKYKTELIAIGNGTAGRETDIFVRDVIASLETKPVKVMVNESGASVYSASPVAIEEFPDLDVSVRGAVSIARRLQDPLAELVKIDPKSIGVGQYQHDVDQKLLKKKLGESVESCVNFVGVDLNTASKELLSYVSGINSAISKNVVEYRNEHGAFQSRGELMQIDKFGPKTFEQAAGFLRIRGGENPLDNTAVHPESYSIVQRIAEDLGVPVAQVTSLGSKIKSVDLKKYVTEEVGEPTLIDILNELEKPGRDPREEFRYAEFSDAVKAMEDLQIGMKLEGVVTNVTDFGAFVDIGVHQDGLVHVSELADNYVSDPLEAVKVGQIVTVRVLDVNLSLRRISLSMRSEDRKKTKSGHKNSQKDKKKNHKKSSEKHYSLDDLKAKFNNRL